MCRSSIAEVALRSLLAEDDELRDFDPDCELGQSVPPPVVAVPRASRPSTRRWRRPSGLVDRLPVLLAAH
jgi:hypothetical protein